MPSSSAEFNPLPSPPTPNSGQQKDSHKRAQYLAFSFKMKNSSNFLNMQEVGEGEISSSQLYICFLQKLLLDWINLAGRRNLAVNSN